MRWYFTLLNQQKKNLRLTNQMWLTNSNSIWCDVNPYNHFGNNLNLCLPKDSVCTLSRDCHEYILHETSTRMLVETVFIIAEIQ